jgi:hypothetical protein
MGRVVVTYDAAGSWVKPAGVTHIEVIGWGGGGGGGHAGLPGETTEPDHYSSGGGGGGGAIARHMIVDISAVLDGFSAAVIIGAGGKGGQNAGEAGEDGGYSLLDFTPPSLTFPGAAGGGPGRFTKDVNEVVSALGGVPMAGAQTVSGGIVLRLWAPGPGPFNLLPPLMPGQGGHASTPNTIWTFNGVANPTDMGTNGGNQGGSAAAAGSHSVSYRGGGAGGGGGGGPFGSGGAGGAGGNANNAGAGAAGADGQNAPANSGAGGGGGGAGGHGSASLGAHGKGGNGGSGRITIIYFV